MHGDKLNRGQGLLPYGGPGCKSESRGEGEGWEEWEATGKGEAASTAQNTPQNPQICPKTAAPPPTCLPLFLSSPFSLPSSCCHAPAAPQGATPSGICVELAASLRLVFPPLLSLGGFKWAVILTFLSSCFLKQVQAPHHPKPATRLSFFPPFSLSLSLFPPLFSSPCRGGRHF